uniref:CCHC-type domain-containing protein n=1 Tax=Tanacetum cinerariifolium TaxID=118510 RepID=A0A699IH40_TANCI|nr:hypothetical protein [Tanacetum cinerariifolium]
MSSSDSAVTYTSISSEDVPFWGIRFFGMKQPDSPEAALQSPIQTPPVPQDEDKQSDPEEDPEEYEDDESEDGLVDYLMDGGDDGDDDDGDSSKDDADDEDDDEEEEEHLALSDSAVVVPAIELVTPPEGTEPVIPPPSTDIATTRAKIIVRLQASISLPSRQRCTAPFAHSSPPPVPSPLLPSSGCPTQIQTLRMASTQALIDAVTVALPSPPLPPPLCIPPPIDRRDDTPEIEMPPRKRLCLFALSFRYEIGESSTARPTGGRGIDYGFVSTFKSGARRQGISKVGYGIRDTWVDPAEAVPEIAPMTWDRRYDDSPGDNVDCRGGGLCFSRGLGSLDIIESDSPSGASDPPGLCVYAQDPDPGTSDIATTAGYSHSDATLDGRDSLSDGRHETRDRRIMAPRTRQGPNAPPNDTNPNNMTPESVQAMIDQALLQNSTNGDGSHSSHEDNQKNIEKIESVFQISGCAIKNQEVLKKKMMDKYCSQGEIKKLEIELWNLKVKGNDVPTYTERFKELTLICTKFVANETEKIDKYISGLPDNIFGSVKSSKPKTLDETIKLANDFMDQKLRTYAERQTDNKRKADDSSRNNHGHFARDCRSSRNINVANTQKGNGANAKGNGCFECGALGHFKRDCPKLKNKDGRNVNVEKKWNASRDPDSNVVTGTFLLNNRYASILFDTGSDRSFISIAFSSLIDIIPTLLGNSYDVKLADGNIVGIFLAQISMKKKEDKLEGKQLKDVSTV